jgi:hypothetical protein
MFEYVHYLNLSMFEYVHMYMIVISVITDN